MSLLGKILAGLCILAAIGCAVLASMDWGARQAAQYEVVRGEVLVDGLPLDGTDLGLRAPFTEPLVQRLPKQLFEELIGKSRGGEEIGASGVTPVTTQVEEVKRAQGAVGTKISSATGNKEKADLLRRYYLPQVGDGKKRDEVLTKLAQVEAGDAKTADELTKALDDLFVDAAADTTTVQPIDAADQEGSKQKDRLIVKRLQIAHLLVHLGPTDTEWLKRVEAVVGLRSFTAAVGRQATALGNMSTRQLKLLRDEQINFLNHYKDLTALARAGADDLARKQKQLAAEQTRANDHAKQAADLKAIVNDHEQKLAAAKAEFEAALKKQAALEQQIFETQRAIRLIEDAIAASELKLRDLEIKSTER